MEIKNPSFKQSIAVTLSLATGLFILSPGQNVSAEETVTEEVPMTTVENNQSEPKINASKKELETANTSHESSNLDTESEETHHEMTDSLVNDDIANNNQISKENTLNTIPDIDEKDYVNNKEEYANSVYELLKAAPETTSEEEMSDLIHDVEEQTGNLDVQQRYIGKEDISEVSANYQSGAEIDLAFDNDEQTNWHSAWDGSGIGQPINIQLSEASQLVGFEYVPRQSGVNGRIKSGTLDIIDDKGQKRQFKIEDWKNDAETKRLLFDQPILTKKIVLTPTSTYGNSANEIDKYASAAELRLLLVSETNKQIDASVFTKKMNAQIQKYGSQEFENIINDYLFLADKQLIYDNILSDLSLRLTQEVERIENQSDTSNYPDKSGNLIVDAKAPFKDYVVKDVQNITVNSENNRRVDLSDWLSELKTLDSGTIYLTYRADSKAPRFLNLFSVSSSENENEYFTLAVNNGVLIAEGRGGDGEQFYDSFNQAPLRVPHGQWHSVAFTFDKEANRVRIYVNGELSQTSEKTGYFVNMMPTVDTVQLGTTKRAGKNFWGGDFEVGELTIYNQELSPEDIKYRSQLMNKEGNVSLSEDAVITDALPIFDAGENDGKNEQGVYSYRIPALLMTKDGTLIAGADERVDHFNDYGNINMVIRRSEDGGKTWQPVQTLLDLPENENTANPLFGSAFAIDMVLLQDDETGRIFAIYDVFPETTGTAAIGGNELSYTEKDGQRYWNLYKENEEAPYLLNEDGQVFDSEGNLTDYLVVTPKHSQSDTYSDLGDIYLNNEKLGNVFFFTNSTSPLRVTTNNAIWMQHSDDDGQTWSAPTDITKQFKDEHLQKFLGVGPGVGITLKTGEHAGRLIVPVYNTNHVSHLSGSQSSRVIYSDDHGKNWHLGAAVNDNRQLEDGSIIHSAVMNNNKAQNTEAVPVQIANGDLKLFMRNLTGSVQMATSKDGGETWENDLVTFDTINDVYVQMSATHTFQNGKEYIVLANANGPGRRNGMVHVLAVADDGTVTHENSKPLQEGDFAYNAIQQVDDDTFGILYEHSDEDGNDFTLYYREVNWTYLTENMEDRHPQVSAIERLDDQHIKVTFDQEVYLRDSAEIDGLIPVSQVSQRDIVFSVEDDLWNSDIHHLDVTGIESLYGQSVQLDFKLPEKEGQSEEPNDPEVPDKDDGSEEPSDPEVPDQGDESEELSNPEVSDKDDELEESSDPEVSDKDDESEEPGHPIRPDREDDLKEPEASQGNNHSEQDIPSGEVITTDNMQIIIPDMTIDHNKPLEEANIEKLSVPQEQASHSDYLVNNDNASNQTAERLPETGQQTNWWYSLVALITGIRLFNYKKRRQGD